MKGVFLNRKLITIDQPTLLNDGDVIGIGVPKMSYSGTDTYIFQFCRASSAKEQVILQFIVSFPGSNVKHLKTFKISNLDCSSLKKCHVVLRDIGSLLRNDISIPVDLFFQLESRLNENSGNDSGRCFLR